MKNRAEQKNSVRVEEKLEKKDNVLLQTALGAIITTCLTLTGTALLQKSQNDNAENLKFLDGAQSAAQETSRLLVKGYSALDELRRSSTGKGLRQYLEGPHVKYREFYREWRQNLIENQFKLTRYYGGDLANNTIHVDEVDKAPVDNLGSPNPCDAPGSDDSYDINKIAVQVECYVRFSAITHDSINSDSSAVDGSLVRDVGRMSSIDGDLNNLMNNYEVSYVKVLRSLDDRLTQLGARKVVVVVRSDSVPKSTESH